MKQTPASESTKRRLKTLYHAARKLESGGRGVSMKCAMLYKNGDDFNLSQLRAMQRYADSVKQNIDHVVFRISCLIEEEETKRGK